MYNSAAIFQLYTISFLCSLQCTRNTMLRCWHLAVPVRENEHGLKLFFWHCADEGEYGPWHYSNSILLIGVVQTSVTSSTHIVIWIGRIMRTRWDFWALLFQKCVLAQGASCTLTSFQSLFCACSKAAFGDPWGDCHSWMQSRTETFTASVTSAVFQRMRFTQH